MGCAAGAQLAGLRIHLAADVRGQYGREALDPRGAKTGALLELAFLGTVVRRKGVRVHHHLWPYRHVRVRNVERPRNASIGMIAERILLANSTPHPDARNAAVQFRTLIGARAGGRER